MPDRVYLLVDGKLIEHFISYSAEADLYTADHAFTLELANPEVQIKNGLECSLWVNDVKELSGIIDRVNPSYNKEGRKLRVEGRDLMGLVVDAYCEQFITIQGMPVTTLANTLLKDVPFIQRKDIIYEDLFTGKIKGRKKKGGSGGIFATALSFAQIEPGRTKFEVLKEYSASRGVLFYCRPDGTFVFGKPREKGEPMFRLLNEKGGTANNILEGELDDNISHRYSKITVIGQQQEAASMGGAGTTPSFNTQATLADPDFPFYKPYVHLDSNDSQSPALKARWLMEKQRADGFRITCKVAGHHQGTNNWAVNELCRVKDDALGVEGVYLIYGRTFTMDKQDGVKTILKLGLPGMIQ